MPQCTLSKRSPRLQGGAALERQVLLSPLQLPPPLKLDANDQLLCYPIEPDRGNPPPDGNHLPCPLLPSIDPSPPCPVSTTLQQKPLDAVHKTTIPCDSGWVAKEWASEAPSAAQRLIATNLSVIRKGGTCKLVGSGQGQAEHDQSVPRSERPVYLANDAQAGHGDYTEDLRLPEDISRLHI